MKNYIHTITLAVALFFSAAMSAQSVTYKYVRNDPFDIRNFSAGIDAMWFEWNGHNSTSFGWGLRGEHMMGKTFLFNTDWRFGFGTSLYRESNENTTNYFYFEAGAGLIFVNNERTKNVPIVLSTQRVGNYQVTTSIRGGVPAKVRTIVAFRFGMFQYNNTLDYSNLQDTLLSFKSLQEDSSYTYLRARDQKKIFTYDLDTTRKNLEINQVGSIAMTCLYAGFQFRSIRNLLIDVDGYGYRGNSAYSDFYLDMIFAPVLLLTDFTVPNGKSYEVTYAEPSRLGWRIGWFWRKPKDQGFSWKMEFGSRPGFKSYANSAIPINGRNLYFMVTGGLYIPLKLKPFYSGDSE